MKIYSPFYFIIAILFLIVGFISAFFSFYCYHFLIFKWYSFLIFLNVFWCLYWFLSSLRLVFIKPKAKKKNLSNFKKCLDHFENRKKKRKKIIKDKSDFGLAIIMFILGIGSALYLIFIEHDWYFFGTMIIYYIVAILSLRNSFKETINLRKKRGICFIGKSPGRRRVSASAIRKKSYRRTK